jgi:hypothetical protein
MGFAVVADEVRSLAQRSRTGGEGHCVADRRVDRKTETGSRTLAAVAGSIQEITDGTARSSDW